MRFEDKDLRTILIHVAQPELNMQGNAAAFEAWAIILRSQQNINVELSFDIPTGCQIDSEIMAKDDSRKQHFLRFLFRAWKFSEVMDWFSISTGHCEDVVLKFKEFFLKTEIINNVPECEAEISKSDKKKEHIIENVFVRVRDSKNLIRSREKIDLPDNLFNQLPNGLFEGKSCQKKAKMFPTGFFDLWGVDSKDELWLFELKTEGNKCAGIVSELFFYANYAKCVFMDKRYNEVYRDFRGYDALARAAERGISKINACFLASEYHPEIENYFEAIEKIMNAKNSGIHYRFLTYDHSGVSKLAPTILQQESTM